MHKVPKERPTYAMLLQQPWLKSFSKPETITEEAEEGDEAEEVAEAVGRMNLSSDTSDEEVADWVKAVIEEKKQGRYGNAAQKPALHAAPLDASPADSPRTD